MFNSIRLLLIILLIFQNLNAFCLFDSIGLTIRNGQKFILHSVDKSQGLYSISKRYHVSVDDIKNANGDTVNKLKVHQIILVPLVHGQVGKTEIIHEVEKGETLYRISKKYNVSVDDIITWNNILDKPIKKGDKLKIFVGKQENEKPKTADSKNEYQKNFVTNSSNSEYIQVDEEGVGTWLDNPSIGTSKNLALHRDAPVGTIIKVTSVLNNKSVFVKVVGNLPKDDQKLKPVIEMTKYSYKQLGLKDKYFLVKLSYHKIVDIPVDE